MKKITAIRKKEVVPGINGHYAHGEKITFGYVEITAGSILPEHHHLHEQITYIMEGQLDMVIGGEPCSLSDNEYIIIPSHTPHSAVAVTDCRLIDVFSPVREDYKE